MKTKADVAIIGCGEAGIFAGYELKKLHPELDIVVVEQGKDIYSRKCPIVAGKVKSCVHCKTCDTMCGFGGAGAFSDGKFNFTTQFGGWLTDYMEPAEVMNLTLLHLHPRSPGAGDRSAEIRPAPAPGSVQAPGYRAEPADFDQHL